MLSLTVAEQWFAAGEAQDFDRTVESVSGGRGLGHDLPVPWSCGVLLVLGRLRGLPALWVVDRVG